MGSCFGILNRRLQRRTHSSQLKILFGQYVLRMIFFNLITLLDCPSSLYFNQLHSSRCGFAKSQAAYDKAIEDLTEAFDRVESILSGQRYIAGNRLTLSDVRLFVTLLRFDEVYVVYFKTNTRSVTTSPVLLNYCREIYQMKGVSPTVNMGQIKHHYFCSHPDWNKWSIVPRGSDMIELLEQPHNRDKISYSPFDFLLMNRNGIDINALNKVV